ncbi:ABC transporter substrate-binding protein [Dehalococcoidia bacterium]|nr:ABC transporter substrate-binding protein [Dehalococcoidia bacterium]
MKHFLIFTLLVTLVVTSACGTSEYEKVRFMAGFKAQGNLPFAAVYVAQTKGYFDKQGLNVEILHSGGGGENLTMLLANKVDFTTADANTVLKHRASQDIPLVAFALFGQRGQQAFVSLAESGITEPADWEGKRFGYKISIPPDYLAILDVSGVDRNKIEEIQVGFDPRILIEEKIDVLAVFKSNEPDTIRSLGHAVNVFDAADLGVPTLGLTYVGTEEIITKKSETTKRFLRATLRAVEFIRTNREESLDIIMNYADKENRNHMKFMLETELSDAITEQTLERGIGWMTTGQWDGLQQHLLKFGALDSEVSISDAINTKFLEEIYDEGKVRWP